MESLGTVIKLRADNELAKNFKIIIVERFVQVDQDSKEYYDYKGTFYPMGSIEQQKGIMFNEEDIEMIYYYGYKDDQDDNFVEIAKRKLDEGGYVKKETK